MVKILIISCLVLVQMSWARAQDKRGLIEDNSKIIFLMSQ